MGREVVELHRLNLSIEFGVSLSRCEENVCGVDDSGIPFSLGKRVAVRSSSREVGSHDETSESF